MAGCIIGVETYIDDGVIVNMGTAIDHDVKIGQFAHLSVGVKVGGEKKIDSFSFIPAGGIIAY